MEIDHDFFVRDELCRAVTDGLDAAIELLLPGRAYLNIVGLIDAIDETCGKLEAIRNRKLQGVFKHRIEIEGGRCSWCEIAGQQQGFQLWMQRSGSIFCRSKSP